MAVIENLITKLSFEFDDGQLKKFDASVKSAVKGLAAMVASAAATATAIFVFTKKIAEANDELGKFAQMTGIDVEALQELGYVAELNGGSIDSMKSSLANLSKVASEAARGMGPGVEVFGMLGISVTDAAGRLKDADDMLYDVSDAISRLGTQAEKLEFAQKLGIGDDLLLSIQQGSEAIRKQRKEARELGFVIDENAAKAAADFNDDLLRMHKVILGVANAVGTRLMKQIDPMIKLFVEWFKANKALIQQNISRFLDGMVKGFRVVFNVLGRVISFVNGLAHAMGGWKVAIIAVTGLLIALNASALLMPILAMAAGAGILLILEDLMKFADGGESAIGDLASRFPILDTALKVTLKLLGLIKDGWLLIFSQGGDALEGLIMMFKDVGRSIADFFLKPLNKVIGLIKKIPTFGLGKSDKDKTDSAKPGQSNLAEAGMIVNQERSPAATNNQSSVSNSSTINKPNINISIHGGDTDKIKQVVTGVLNQQYSGAQTNLSSQVDS